VTRNGLPLGFELLVNCTKNGLEAEAKKHPVFKGNARAFGQYLRGFAAYLNMVQPGHGAALLRRAGRQ